MKKRKTRRNPIARLDAIQESSLLYGGDGAFESKLQRRAAWFAHREALIELDIENIPGTRPAAFFEYEYPEAKDYPGERWEYLLQNNLLHENELAGITALWTWKLELSIGRLALNPRELKPWQRQAELLGGPAPAAFKRVKKAVRERVKKYAETP